MPESVSLPFVPREIDCFLTVAETLHFRSAAEQLFIPQPHLSRTIRRLEERLGVQLFERTSRRVQLSPAGRVFAEEVRAMRSSAQRAARRAQLAALGAAGSLSVGGIASAALDPMPQHIASFAAAFPEVRVALSEDGSAQLWEALRAYELDIAYARPIDTDGFRVQELGTEANCVVTLGTDALARLPMAELSDLDAKPFVYFPSRRGPKGHAALMSTFAGAGVEPQLVAEVPSVTAAIGFVRAGAGCTILPSGYKSLAPDLAFIPLHGAGPPVRLVIATRDEPAPLVDAYLSHIRSMSPGNPQPVNP
jgi:DNA-binding transcriptional LysR family regulator